MTESLRLTTSDGLSLEAVIDQPVEPRAVLVLCHPHPKMGGTMNAPLLRAVTDHLVSSGWAVLRFNFRGIGSSEGTPSTGIEEIKDAEAAIAQAQQRWPDLPLALAGWSFGAAVAIRVAAGRDDVAALVAIAPAVKEKPGITAGLPDPGEVRLKMPARLIAALNDDLVSPEDCVDWSERAGATCTVMKGANHFFWAKYDKLAEEVAGFLSSAVGVNG
ncbi:MAG: alpha/beta hydrolase [Actinomycetota bacterium]